MVVQFLDRLYSGAPMIEGEQQLHGSLAEIEREAVAPQVLCLLNESRWMNLVSCTFVERLRHLREKITGQTLFVRYHQARVFEAFEHSGIPVIPLKGTLFAERYFGHFLARPTSDIDIFVTSSNLDKAIRCLQELGFVGPEPHNPMHFHCLMWKRMNTGDFVLNIELHWSLVQENSAKPSWDEFWRDAGLRGDYRYVHELSVQHTFYCMCLHGANHKMDGLKYLLDVAHLLFRHGSEIDLMALLEVCRRDGTLRRVKAVLNVVYQQLPSLHQMKPLPYPIRRGRLGDAVVLKIPVFTPDSWRVRLQRLKEWCWPQREVAMWYLRDDSRCTHTNVYRRFYRRRLMHLIRFLGVTKLLDG